MNLISIIGCVVKCIENLYAICLGRFIFGFAIGVYSVAVPRILEETIPNHL